MKLSQEEITNLLIENRNMTIALQFIEKWELPEVRDKATDKLWSYEASKGSNGAREYVRNIARKALEQI